MITIINCYCGAVSSSRNLASITRGRVAQGGRTILREVGLELAAGSLTVVTGSNGSGKSTLLAALAGLLSLEEGELRLGRDVRRAYVPQRSEASDALPLTVADVVGMGRWFRRPLRDLVRNRHEDRSVTATSIAAVGLAGLERRSLAELSGGQRQRAFLAQGLAQRADLLLLDEPESGLDVDGVRLLFECIAAERARGVAVVLVTHDRRSPDATQRVHLHGGRIEIGNLVAFH